jgi:hypothetical protein
MGAASIERSYRLELNTELTYHTQVGIEVCNNTPTEVSKHWPGTQDPMQTEAPVGTMMSFLGFIAAF